MVVVVVAVGTIAVVLVSANKVGDGVDRNSTYASYLRKLGCDVGARW